MTIKDREPVSIPKTLEEAALQYALKGGSKREFAKARREYVKRTCEAFLAAAKESRVKTRQA